MTSFMLALYSITKPSVSRAATQNASVVTAVFINKPPRPDPGNPAAVHLNHFAGIFSLSPTLMRSVVKPFADLSAATVVWNCDAILLRLSPDFTV